MSMHRSFLMLALASVSLSACATHLTADAPATTAGAGAGVGSAASAPAPAADATPRPQLGTYGFDDSGKDESVAPGDNFYQYANGTWEKNTPIPADKANYGMFTALDD